MYAETCTHTHIELCLLLCCCHPSTPQLLSPTCALAASLLRTPARACRQQMGADRERAREDDEPILLSMIDSGLSTPAA